MPDAGLRERCREWLARPDAEINNDVALDSLAAFVSAEVERERDSLRAALREIVNCLGPTICDCVAGDACEGLQVEAGHALEVARRALGAGAPATPATPFHSPGEDGHSPIVVGGVRLSADDYQNPRKVCGKCGENWPCRKPAKDAEKKEGA